MHDRLTMPQRLRFGVAAKKDLIFGPSVSVTSGEVFAYERR
jgi:hypothetical protein